MNIVAYLKRINTEAQKIFAETIEDHESFGKAHHISTCIFEFSTNIQDNNEKEMLRTVSSQLESGSINLAYGLYRQAFASLRLAFEMALGTIYFSIHKMEHFEWLEGKADIKWAKLIDSENGVLSKRFANAFFPELAEHVESFNKKAADTYRELSEYVHGNSQTWINSGLVLKLNNESKIKYFALLDVIGEIILFSLGCRYLKSISTENHDNIDFMASELNYIAPIRELLGGPKEL